MGDSGKREIVDLVVRSLANSLAGFFRMTEVIRCTTDTLFSRFVTKDS